ncbi:MAG: IS110 family transposase [Ignavibacteriaceae bacterium]
MRFYTQQHQYYCGIDLHTKSMYICIVNQEGKILYHYDLPTQSEALFQVIKPYLPNLVIAVECIFTWYWIADFCAQHHIPFVLGHALYMKAIHGAKTKNDRIDSQKIALLLRAGMIPMAYVYPAEMRSTRDLLRRRMYFVHKRSELLSHIQNTRSQYNLPNFEKRLDRKNNRIGINQHFNDPSVRKSMELNLSLLDTYETLLKELELFLVHHAQVHDPNNLYLLKTIPGVGKILALVMLYEIHDITRFPTVQNFVSYARLIKPRKESAGKITGTANRKMGNAYLRWAFGEAATLMLREIDDVKAYHQKLKNKHGKAKAMAIISHRIGRATYFMLKNQRAFNLKKFITVK